MFESLRLPVAGSCSQISVTFQLSLSALRACYSLQRIITLVSYSKGWKFQGAYVCAKFNGIVMSVWVIPRVPRGKEIKDCSYPTKNDRMFSRSLQALHILNDSHIPDTRLQTSCFLPGRRCNVTSSQGDNAPYKLTQKDEDVPYNITAKASKLTVKVFHFWEAREF